MAVEIPFSKKETNYTFDVTLTNVVYTFDVYWNVRSENYFMNITRAQDQAVVLQGARVAVSTAPLFGIAGEYRPPGELFVIDTTELELDPRLYELGDRVRVLYFEPSELE